MAWDLKSDRAIYLQLTEKIIVRIITGVYKAGDKLPSVRDLAEEAGVNPNTMQKALSDLEGKGLVFSQRTSGRFITEDENLIKGVMEALALAEVKEFLEKMEKLGFKGEEILELINNVVKEKN